MIGKGTLTDFENEFENTNLFVKKSKNVNQQEKFELESEENCNKKYKNFVLLINTDKDLDKDVCKNFEDVYELKNEQLGEGAFGYVRKAFNKITKKPVVLKIQKDINTKKLFMNEIYNLKKISKKCDLFVCLEGWGILNNKIFIVLEFLNGTTLKNYIYDNDLKINEIIYICNQLIQKIQFIHEQGLAHADIKPDNIIINNDIVRIIDFGISCDDFKIPCHKGGTTIYMPKITKVSSKLENRQKTDWFALLLILFEMLNIDFDEKDDEEENKYEIKKIINKQESKNIQTLISTVYNKYI